ncbi:MAG: photosystem I assembly protein Ycf4 [Leptolyngbya sp. SIO4C5]|nr:photosystem I assembly protein Ycf4 [Leptolyngbya sp. SIO4C5]
MSMSTAAAENMRLRREVLGARRLSNYWWATIVTVGGLGFFLASVSSYLKINLLPFANPTELIFVPQGIVMGFYGVAALLLATYLWLIISWDVGGGYNEFDKQSGQFTVFRWGFPGQNREIKVSEALDNIQAVKVAIKEGLNPKRALYLRVKGRGEIPLTRVGQPLALSTLENQGAELARFLQVPLEGL